MLLKVRDRTDQGIRRTVDLKALEVFVRLCETRNMTQVGRELGVTQSAVSHIVRQMEKELGVQLVERSTRPLAITAAGDLLRKHAERLLGEAEMIESLVRSSGSEAVPFIALGLLDSLAATVGPPLVKGLSRHAKELSTMSANATRLREALVKRQLNMIVTCGEIEDVEGLTHHRLLREPFLLMMGPKTAQRCEGMALDQLAQKAPFVRPSSTSMTGMMIEQHLRRLKIKIPSRFEFDTADVLLATLAADFGWTIMPTMALMHMVHTPHQIVARSLPGLSLSRNLTLVVRDSEIRGIAETATGLTRDIVRTLVPRSLEAIDPQLLDAIEFY
jgi:DNA-binding transcriptional LysR family regulator